MYCLYSRPISNTIILFDINYYFRSDNILWFKTIMIFAISWSLNMITEGSHLFSLIYFPFLGYLLKFTYDVFLSTYLLSCYLIVFHFKLPVWHELFFCNSCPTIILLWIYQKNEMNEYQNMFKIKPCCNSNTFVLTVLTVILNNKFRTIVRFMYRPLTATVSTNVFGSKRNLQNSHRTISLLLFVPYNSIHLSWKIYTWQNIKISLC